MDNNLFYNDKKPIDDLTDYGKGHEPKVDSRTDFGKGISFKSVDGREWATMEQAEAVNRAFYESLIIKSQNNNEEEPRQCASVFSNLVK